MFPKDHYVQKTHLSICKELVGKVEKIETGKSARVALMVSNQMKADDRGLIHGGFTFGLADYAAMVAVNDPFVVLLSSNVRFLKPVIFGDRLTADARVTEVEGKNIKVWCDVFNQGDQKVFEGEFLCRILNKHVLEK